MVVEIWRRRGGSSRGREGRRGGRAGVVESGEGKGSRSGRGGEDGRGATVTERVMEGGNKGVIAGGGARVVGSGRRRDGAVVVKRRQGMETRGGREG